MKLDNCFPVIEPGNRKKILTVFYKPFLSRDTTSLEEHGETTSGVWLSCMTQQ